MRNNITSYFFAFGFFDQFWLFYPLFGIQLIYCLFKNQSKIILPPLHLICQIAVLLVLTVLDPACPLSMDGETATEKKNQFFREIKFTKSVFENTNLWKQIIIKMNILTIFMSAEMRSCMWRWFRLSSLVDGNYSELVPFALAKARNSGF